MSGQATSERYCKGGCGRLIPYVGMGRPRVWCSFCSKDETRKTARRKALRRFIADDFGTIRCYKRCTACKRWKELVRENFTVRSHDKVTGQVREWQAECRPCINERCRREWAARDPDLKTARTRRQYERLRNDPERWEQKRVRQRERDRVRRAAMTPEQRAAYNAQKREAWARRMEQPGVREQRAEDRRLIERMRAEEAGRDVVSRPAMNAYLPSVGHAESAHVEPLAVWLEAMLAEDRREMTEIAESLGIGDRALRRVLHREYATVTIGLADRLVWGYNKPIKLPDGEEIAGTLAERCRSMPGNGERILRYMDLAERIGHLDGAVVDSIRDLWPELA